MRADLIDTTIVAPARAFRRVGEWQPPLHLTPLMAEDLLDLRHMVCLRRIGLNRSDWPRNLIFRALRIQICVFASMMWPEKLAGLVDDGNRRVPPLLLAMSPLTMAERTAIQIPSDDEVVPEIQQVSSSPNPPFGFADSASESEREMGKQPGIGQCSNAEGNGRCPECSLFPTGSRKFAG